MNTLDTIASGYLERSSTPARAEALPWAAENGSRKDVCREDVRIILVLIADAMHRAGPAEIYSAAQAEAWLRAVAEQEN